MGIRAKMNFSIILLLLLMTVFFDLTVYQIYKQDIEAKEIASMGDANEILSDNIMNLIGSVEENLMSEIGRCGVFSYQASLSETVSASVERKMKGLATLMHFRGIDCRNTGKSWTDESSFFRAEGVPYGGAFRICQRKFIL